MNMPCRIEDEYIDNEPSDDKEGLKLKSLEEISLYDILATHTDLFLKKNPDGSYSMEIECLDEPWGFKDGSIHKAAIDSMADFCSSFMWFYNRNRDK